ncbi:MAG: ChaN family lipoprotein [Chromatiales bacterium]|nr:ChaN family lipoprotein [Chromatiales bacterium]
MRKTCSLSRLASILAAATLLTACSIGPDSVRAGASQQPTASGGVMTLPLNSLRGLDAFTADLAAKRVVFVGETHDRLEHHLNQLEVLQKLHTIHPRIAIGVEWFQQPFQNVLDDYIAGRIDEAELIRRSEYYDRWRFDYRLYRPILDYARKHAIPVIALNLEAEITRTVGREGFDALDADQRARIPPESEIDRNDDAYRERLRQVFDQHPMKGRSFENFENVQLLWDEGMASRAAKFLNNHPDHTLVVFAGSGHIAYGDGIPKRVARRTGADFAIVLSSNDDRPDPQAADYLLFADPKPLPASGRLGVYLENADEGVIMKGFADQSGAKDAGLEEGDLIVGLDDSLVKSYADVKIHLQDKSPGDTVLVKVKRKNWLSQMKEHEAQVVLR